MDTRATPTPAVAEAPVLESQATPAERLREFSKMLRRRWRIVVMVMVLTTAAALASSLSSPKQYEATAKLLLRADEPIEALVGRAPGGGSTADPERETNTKVALIKLETVADRVANKLGLSIPTQELLSQVSAEVEGTSDIVAITVRDRDPRQAARIADGFAEEYVAFRRESAQRSIDEAVALARTRLNSLDPVARASAEGRQLEARQRELEIASSLQTGGAEVVLRAAVPTTAASPRPKLAGLLGVLFGLILGIAAAALFEFLDRRLRDVESAQTAFELPLLAVIPKPARSSDTVLLNGDRAIEEAYGTLAANVVFAKRARDLSVIMITSHRSGDGKTSTAFGLARALRTLGQRVIIVEADLHHPRFVQVCNIAQRGGLSSLLAREGKLRDELVPLDSHTLNHHKRTKAGSSFSVLPAGPVPPNPSAMLSRPVMGQILDECRRQADVVLIDTAPVGLVHDPLTLVNHVDGVIVVARLDHTTKDGARKVVRLLNQVGARILGVALIGGPRTAGYYGYGKQNADSRHFGRPTTTKTKTKTRTKTKSDPPLGADAESESEPASRA